MRAHRPGPRGPRTADPIRPTRCRKVPERCRARRGPTARRHAHRSPGPASQLQSHGMTVARRPGTEVRPGALRLRGAYQFGASMRDAAEENHFRRAEAVKAYEAVSPARTLGGDARLDPTACAFDGGHSVAVHEYNIAMMRMEQGSRRRMHGNPPVAGDTGVVEFPRQRRLRGQLHLVERHGLLGEERQCVGVAEEDLHFAAVDRAGPENAQGARLDQLAGGHNGVFRRVAEDCVSLVLDLHSNGPPTACLRDVGSLRPEREMSDLSDQIRRKCLTEVFSRSRKAAHGPETWKSTQPAHSCCSFESPLSLKRTREGYERFRVGRLADAPALPRSAVGYCPALRLLKSQTLHFSSSPASRTPTNGGGPEG